MGIAQKIVIITGASHGIGKWPLSMDRCQLRRPHEDSTSTMILDGAGFVQIAPQIDLNLQQTCGASKHCGPLLPPTKQFSEIRRCTVDTSTQQQGYVT